MRVERRNVAAGPIDPPAAAAAAAPEAAAAVARVAIRLRRGRLTCGRLGRRDGGGSHSAPLRATRSGDPVPAFFCGESDSARGETRVRAGRARTV